MVLDGGGYEVEMKAQDIGFDKSCLHVAEGLYDPQSTVRADLQAFLTACKIYRLGRTNRLG